MITFSTVVPLELWDCPANTTVESLGVPLSSFAAIIFVIDIRVRPFFLHRPHLLISGRIFTINLYQSLSSSSLRRTMRIQE